MSCASILQILHFGVNFGDYGSELVVDVKVNESFKRASCCKKASIFQDKGCIAKKSGGKFLSWQ